MDYLRHYYKLVNNAFLSNRQKCEEFEGHHVKPYSLGGKRIVLLTAKEHYIAHYLLYKHFNKYGNKDQKIKMARAFNAMTFSSTSNIQRYTSRSFAIARKAFRESIQGINHPFYGKTHSNETRAKNLKEVNV